jgi:hypothetical protein
MEFQQSLMMMNSSEIPQVTDVLFLSLEGIKKIISAYSVTFYIFDHDFGEIFIK